MSLLESAFPFVALERGSVETEGAYLLIALQRSSQYKAYKNQEVTSFSLRNSIP